MALAANEIDVYLEVGAKRTFAGAIDWPGWCRSGADETSALQTLFAYGPRYARVLGVDPLGFNATNAASMFQVVERLKGNQTTDFGAPGLAPASDSAPVDEAELQRQQRILAACWREFEKAVGAATGKELSKGPRGGGRELEVIVTHVIDSTGGYLSKVGGKLRKEEGADPVQQIHQTQQAVQEALTAAARGEVAARGPRGGERWPPRYFVRREAWHILDHAWEIEDRIIS
jgi:hypothetical protein